MSFKIAFIGAGSLVFARTLFTDIISVPEFHDIEIAFTDINPDNLEKTRELCQRDLDANNIPIKIEATTNRRDAFKDARYIVNCVRIGGRVTWLMPFAVCSRWLCVGWDCNSTSWDLFCCSGAPKGLSRLCATPSGSQYKVVLHWWLSHGCPRSPAPPRYIAVWIRVTYAECMQICRKESHAPAGPSDRTSRRR